MVYTDSMTNHHDTDRKGLKPGAEVSLTGIKGRFTVHRIIGREVTCYGGHGYRQSWRTVTIDRIKSVHYRKPERKPPARLLTTPVAERLPSPSDIDKGRVPARRR